MDIGSQKNDNKHVFISYSSWMKIKAYVLCLDYEIGLCWELIQLF